LLIGMRMSSVDCTFERRKKGKGGQPAASPS